MWSSAWNKAHFRNLLLNTYLPSTVSRAFEWWSRGPVFNPHWGQFLTIFFVLPCMKIYQIIWQKPVSWKTRLWDDYIWHLWPINGTLMKSKIPLEMHNGVVCIFYMSWSREPTVLSKDSTLPFPDSLFYICYIFFPSGWWMCRTLGWPCHSWTLCQSEIYS